MNPYRRLLHTRWFLIGALSISVVVFLCVAYAFDELAHTRIKIDTRPVELYEAPKVVVNPCIDLLRMDDQNKKLIAELRQRQSVLLSELALEVELVATKGGKVNSSRIVELLRKYDNTETRIYSKLYPVERGK